MKNATLILKKFNRRKKGLHILFTAAVLFGLFFAAGCKSTETFVSERSLFGYLPQESSITGKIDIENNRELFTRIVAGLLGAEEELTPLFDRTAAVLFAAELSHNKVINTYFIIQGNFPRGITSSIISSDEKWEKNFYGTIPWWENKEEQIQIAVPARGIIFAASEGTEGEGIEGMLERYRDPFPPAVNREVLHEMEVSDFVLYLRDPAETLLGDFPIDLEKFPLDSMWFTMLQSQNIYHLSGAFLLGTAEEAKKMAMFTRILLVGWIRKNDLGEMGKLKETLMVQPRGNYVRISGITFDQGAAERFILSLLPAPGTSRP